MNIAHRAADWKRLFHALAIPGWVLLGWRLLETLSTLGFLASIIQSVRSHVGGAWSFLSSAAGNVVLILLGFAWLAAVVFWPRRKSWSDAMAEEDAAHMQERVRQTRQRIEFHFAPGADPYIEIITELCNATVFDLANFGEISGRAIYAGKPLSAVPCVIVPIEPVHLRLKHADTLMLVVRQFLSSEVADMMWANRNRGIPVDFRNVAITFKMLLPGLPVQEYRWWGPQITLDNAERV